MTKPQKRLGRGLEALLGRGSGGEAAPAHDAEHQKHAPTVKLHRFEEEGEPEEPQHVDQTLGILIDVDRIDSNKYQPREDFDQGELEAFCSSITDHGLLQPVVVRQVEDRYELIAGERRLRAAKLAGWWQVPAKVIEADDRQSAELAIVENVQRKDLGPLEKAASFQRYIEQYGCSKEELAARLKLDRSTVANLIRLLELPGGVQEALRASKITQGHARALLPLGEEREQVDFCQRIQREKLSVRQTESLVQETIAAADGQPLSVVGGEGKPTGQGKVQSEQIVALEQEFRAALGLKVKITQNTRGRGKLVITSRNHQEFDHLRSQIGGPGKMSKAG